MASYPQALKSFRVIENVDGVVYDQNDTKTIFAEDETAIRAEIVAIETVLGINVQGARLNVRERLEAIEAELTTNLQAQITGIAAQIGEGVAGGETSLAVRLNVNDTRVGATEARFDDIDGQIIEIIGRLDNGGL